MTLTLLIECKLRMLHKIGLNSGSAAPFRASALEAARERVGST
jgi:hypothetical protein